MRRAAKKSATQPAVPLAAVEKTFGLNLFVARDRYDRLTPREREVAEKIAGGERSRSITAALGIKVQTLNLYRIRILRKLEVRTTVDVANLVNLLRLAKLAEGERRDGA